MGEAFIVRRGGTGGMSTNAAVIHVNAPLGSTISFSKGSVVVKTISPAKSHINSDGETADYYYTVSASNFGSWTVTATKAGENTVSETFTVSAAYEYDILIAYRVPYEYQAVEYLQNNSGAYFDSGIKTDGLTTIQVDTHIAVAVASGNPVIFEISARYGALVSSQYGQWRFYYSPNEDYDTVTGYQPTIGARHHLVYNTVGGAVYLDGAQVAPGRTRTCPAGRGYLTILLGAGRYGDTVQAYGTWRYEDFVISNTATNTVLADLRPCYRKADNVAGFWDAVAGRFITPSGGGTVTVGPDI